MAVEVSPLKLMPPPTLIDPPAKLLPVSVTATLLPCVALDGLMLLSVGASGITEKFNLLVVPVAEVKERFLKPNDALGSMRKVAVTSSADFTVLLMVIPANGFMLAPVKLKPVMATAKVEPCDPTSGLIEVITGSVRFMAQYPPDAFTQFC